MNTLTNKALAVGIYIGPVSIKLFLDDGRTLEIDYRHFPLLAEGNLEKRRNVEIYADGMLIHWPDLDEDIAVEHLLKGKFPVK